jgi:ABC-type glycerol-3-phosphate transport system substrate-binding protein
MIFIGRWYLNMLRDRPELGPHLHTMLVPAFPGQPSRSVIGGRGAGINAKSPRRDEAMKFLAYLASEPYNDLIINDGDGLPPNPAFARNGADLVNDLVPDPDFHQAFIDSAAAGQPLDVSPFVDAGQVSRWLRERIDRVENSPTLDIAETMRGLAREVNLRIRRNVAREGHLQRKFEEVTGQPYSAEALVRWQEDDQRRAAIAP